MVKHANTTLKAEPQPSLTATRNELRLGERGFAEKERCFFGSSCSVLRASCFVFSWQKA